MYFKRNLKEYLAHLLITLRLLSGSYFDLHLHEILISCTWTSRAVSLKPCVEKIFKMDYFVDPSKIYLSFLGVSEKVHSIDFNTICTKKSL